MAAIEVKIRESEDHDRAGIEAVEKAAFGRPEEAVLALTLLQQPVDAYSLVAFQDEKMIGHVLFSPMSFVPAYPQMRAVGLGPLAVDPDWQRKGVGSQLILHGLDYLRTQGIHLVFVLGDPGYYRRFGFKPAELLHARCNYPVEPQYFMGLVLNDPSNLDWQGTALYHPEFDKV